MRPIQKFLRYWRCVLFHRKEVFEYIDTINYPTDQKRKMYGCKRCDLWMRIL